MFLNRLNDEEKLAFISLARNVQLADNDVSEEEKLLIQGYYHEMNLFGVKEIEYSDDELINVFKYSTIENKKIVIFEAIGLAYADGDYSINEKNLINKIAYGIGITDDALDYLNEYVVSYIKLAGEINEIIHNTRNV